jgi:hypothetical protein
MRKLVFILLAVVLWKNICSSEVISNEEYAFNVYYDDTINPGFRFRFLNGSFYLEVPETDDNRIEEGIYIREIVDCKYELVEENGFKYIKIKDRKYLLLMHDVVCILVDCTNGDAFFGINIKSPYVKLPGRGPKHNKIGIYGGASDFQQTSSVLSEMVKGKRVIYNGLDRYHFQIRKPWIEGKKDYGINEWIQKKIHYKTNEIVIINGYIDPNRPDLYVANSRVKEILITTKYGEWAYALKDTPIPQILTLPVLVDGDIRFTIRDVYRGEKYMDTAIAGIYFLF